jgi:hypothetical protein
MLRIGVIIRTVNVSQMNLIHRPTSFFFKSHLDIIFPAKVFRLPIIRVYKRRIEICCLTNFVRDISGYHSGKYEDYSLLVGYIATCSVVEVDRRPYDEVRMSETSVYFNETTWHYIPEGCSFQILFEYLMDPLLV